MTQFRWRSCSFNSLTTSCQVTTQPKHLTFISLYQIIGNCEWKSLTVTVSTDNDVDLIKYTRTPCWQRRIFPFGGHAIYSHIRTGLIPANQFAEVGVIMQFHLGYPWPRLLQTDLTMIQRWDSVCSVSARSALTFSTRCSLVVSPWT